MGTVSPRAFSPVHMLPFFGPTVVCIMGRLFLTRRGITIYKSHLVRVELEATCPPCPPLSLSSSSLSLRGSLSQTPSQAASDSPADRARLPVPVPGPGLGPASLSAAISASGPCSLEVATVVLRVTFCW
jgi:hypothetical protein